MEIEHRIEGKTCIVNIDGKIIFDSTGKFKTYMKPLIENEAIKGVALNFANVNFIDSFGIGEVFFTFKALRKRGAKMAIYNISQKNNELFKILGFNKILNFQGTEEEALSSLQGTHEN